MSRRQSCLHFSQLNLYFLFAISGGKFSLKTGHVLRRRTNGPSSTYNIPITNQDKTTWFVSFWSVSVALTVLVSLLKRLVFSWFSKEKIRSSSWQINSLLKFKFHRERVPDRKLKSWSKVFSEWPLKQDQVEPSPIFRSAIIKLRVSVPIKQKSCTTNMLYETINDRNMNGFLWSVSGSEIKIKNDWFEAWYLAQQTQINFGQIGQTDQFQIWQWLENGGGYTRTKRVSKSSLLFCP